MDEARRVLEWQNVIIAFCFSSAIDITILFAQPKSELSPLYCVLSFAILTTFLSLFVSKFIVHKFAAASQVLEKAAAIVAATALVLATTIPYSAKLKYATWSLYAVSLLTIVICNFIVDTTLPEINDKSAWETEKEAQLVEEHTKGPARMRRAPTYLKDYIT